jgi:hypothetical protein
MRPVEILDPVSVDFMEMAETAPVHSCIGNIVLQLELLAWGVVVGRFLPGQSWRSPRYCEVRREAYLSDFYNIEISQVTVVGRRSSYLILCDIC